MSRASGGSYRLSSAFQPATPSPLVQLQQGVYARLRSLCCAKRPASMEITIPDVPEATAAVPDMPELPAASPGGETSAVAAARASATHSWLEANDLLGSTVEEGAASGVGIVYDETMLQHCGPEGHPERPARVREILEQLRLSGLLTACSQLPSREALAEELVLCHDPGHVERVLHFEAPARRRAKPFSFPFGPDTYVCEQTPLCARLAAGSPLNLVDAVFDEDSPVGCGMAVVRPPGHHATADKASGFCLFNNIAVAARYAQERHKVKRVAIIDWDVHHGNGTNDIFEEDADVLFFSMHRCELGFFPGTGFHEDAGRNDGKGYTVNVPLDKGFGDVDVSYVVRYVLCPLLERFRPEVIFVSAGFDAVKGDPLGGCRISPECYGWMTRCIYRLAKHYCEGRLILLLEGGYNPDAIAQCTVECLQALVAESMGLTVGQQRGFEGLCPSALTTPAVSAHPTPSASPHLPSMSPALLALASPALTSTSSPSASPRTALDGSSAGQRTPTSTPTSPSMRPQKAKMPANKTVSAVRKLTELHHMLPLELPLAPKQADGSSKTDKNAKKNAQKKRNRNQSGDGADLDPGADSDGSGWAIALGGLSEPDLPSTVPTPQRTPSSRAAVPPSFNLPPAFPSLTGDTSGGGGYPGERERGVEESASEPRTPPSASPPGSPVTSQCSPKASSVGQLSPKASSAGQRSPKAAAKGKGRKKKQMA